jgi:DNA-directed RNA polymerase subunit RPC12/RpoP
MITGRIPGLILLGVAVAILLATGAWLVAAGASESTATLGGQVLGFALVFIFLFLPLAAIGVYLLVRGRGEEAAMAQARQERRLLNMVLTQGKVRFDEAAIELRLTRREIEAMVRDLVGKQLFTGAVNWETGVLYSKEATQLKADRKCPNCGGEVQLAGRGVIRCPYCGSEVFLHLA